MSDGGRAGRIQEVLRRHSGVIEGAGVVALVVAGVLAALTPSRYRAETSFFIEARSVNSVAQSLAGLAGQLGVLPEQNATQSPQFFANLVYSRALLARVIDGRYPMSRGDSVSLFALLAPKQGDSLVRAEAAWRGLVRRVGVSLEPRTGVLTVTVTLGDPVLAAAVANGLVQELNAFNLQTRQTQARARRVFAQQRVAEAADTLRAAEGELRDFLERNHEWRSSPTLTFEQGRLDRHVTIAQEVYLTLRRELETARLDEVNDTPTVSVIDPAVAPTKRAGPHRILNTVLAALFAVVLVGWAIYAVEAALAAGRAVPSLVRRLYAGLPSARPGSRGA
jgi:uncharacterized protein involved in exopolysaccharide biosynthesis